MGVKVIKKHILDSYKYVISIPLDAMPSMFSGWRQPIGSTYGVYGKYTDVYVYDDDTAITTGMRPFGNIVPDHDLIHKYELLARSAHINYEWHSLSEVRAKLEGLMDKFVKECLELNKE